MLNLPAQSPGKPQRTTKALANLACFGISLVFGFAPAGHAQVQQMSAAMEVRSEAPVTLRVFAVEWEFDGPVALRHIHLQLSNSGPQAPEATLFIPARPQEQLRAIALDTHGRLVGAAPLNRSSSGPTEGAGTPGGAAAAPQEKDQDSRYRVRVAPIPAQGQRTVRITVASTAQDAPCGWLHPLVLPQGAYHGFLLSAKARSELQPSAHATWREVGNHSEGGERTWMMSARTSTQMPKTVCIKPQMPLTLTPPGLPG
jgi:hypothetical protein